MKKMKSKLAQALALPKEVVLDMTVVQATGRNEVLIENYKSLVEFSETKIRVRARGFFIALEGQNLALLQVTAENLLIGGAIDSVLYS